MTREHLSSTEAEEGLSALESAPIRVRSPRQLGRSAWELATELGWAKTYDAEYLALARLLGCGLVTLDRRMFAGAERLDIDVSSSDL